MSEPLLTVHEIAERLNISPLTVYRWHRTGDGPPRWKINRAVRYRWSEVEAWIQRQNGGDAA